MGLEMVMDQCGEICSGKKLQAAYILSLKSTVAILSDK